MGSRMGSRIKKGLGARGIRVRVPIPTMCLVCLVCLVCLELDGGLVGDGCVGGLGLGLGLVGHVGDLGSSAKVWLGEVTLLGVPRPLCGSDIMVNHDLTPALFREVVEDIVGVGRVGEDDVGVGGHVGLGVEWRAFLGEGEVDAFDGVDNFGGHEDKADMCGRVSLADARNDEGNGAVLGVGESSASERVVEVGRFLSAVIVEGCAPREGRFTGDVGEELGEVTLDDLPEAFGVCLVVLDLEAVAVVDLFADLLSLGLVKPVEEVDVHGSECVSTTSAANLDVVNVAKVELAEDGKDVLARDGEVDAWDAQGRVEGMGHNLDHEVAFTLDSGGDGAGEVDWRGRGRHKGRTALDTALGGLGRLGHRGGRLGRHCEVLACSGYSKEYADEIFGI